MENEVIVERFDPRSDIIDLSNYNYLVSVEDLSYSTNPLRIFLSDPSAESSVSPSQTGVSRDSSSRSLQHTLDTRVSAGEGEEGERKGAVISQQSIVLSDQKDMHGLSARNFLFAPVVGGSDSSSSSHLEELISFGLIILGAVFVVVLATFRKEEVDEESNAKIAQIDRKLDIEEADHLPPDIHHPFQGDRLIVRVLDEETRRAADDSSLYEDSQLGPHRSHRHEDSSESSQSDSSSSSGSGSGWDGDSLSSAGSDLLLADPDDVHDQLLSPSDPHEVTLLPLSLPPDTPMNSNGLSSDFLGDRSPRGSGRQQKRSDPEGSDGFSVSSVSSDRASWWGSLPSQELLSSSYPPDESSQPLPLPLPGPPLSWWTGANGLDDQHDDNEEEEDCSLSWQFSGDDDSD
jgi:hypothetical protein